MEGKGTAGNKGRGRRVRAGGQILSIKDLNPDPKNRRQRTGRGRALLDESLHRLGPARSIVIDEKNEILAGNGVIESAERVGLDRVMVVEADGKTIVAVRRTGLSDQEKRDLAMFDNRAGELAEWDPAQIAADRQNGLDLQPYFTEGELKALIGKGAERELTVEEVQTTDVADRFWISIRGPLKHQAKALERLKQLLAELGDVQVELGTIAAEELTPVL